MWGKPINAHLPQVNVSIGDSAFEEIGLVITSDSASISPGGLLDFQEGKAVYEMSQQELLGPVAC